MFTFRNVFALVLFLFGATFLWLTAAFLGDKQAAAKGAVWTVVQISAILVIIGFADGAWGSSGIRHGGSRLRSCPPSPVSSC